MKEQQTVRSSEQYVVEAPFSFTGATKRIWPLTKRSDNENIRNFVLIPGVIILLWVVYSAILMWYVIFGIFLIPYRLIRRSYRKHELENIRHREIVEALSKQKAP